MIFCLLVDGTRVDCFEFHEHGISVPLLKDEGFREVLHYFRLLGDYVGTEFVLRYSLVIEFILVYFESVLECLKKTKILFREDKLLDSSGEELLLRPKEYQLVRRRLLLE